MKSLSRFSILLIALTGAGAAPAAEPQTEQKLAYELGRCLVQRDRSIAVDVLNRLPFWGGDVRFVDGDLGDASSCLTPEMTGLSPIAIRGGIAQELFLRDFAEFGLEPKRKRDFADLALPISAEAEAEDDRTHALYTLGDCVVRNRTDSIEDLLNAPVGSRAEQKLIDSLAPIVAACHANRGQARVSREDFRSILAQSAYSASVRYWSGRLQAVKS